MRRVRVLLTRAAEDNAHSAAALRSRGLAGVLAAGLPVHAEARSRGLDGMIEALAAALAARGTER